MITPDKYIFERVIDQDTLENEWYPAFVSMFTDPEDRESLEMLKGRLPDFECNIFNLLRSAETGQVVGINLLNRNPEIEGAVYCPYGGVAEGLRGEGLYPRMTRHSDRVLQKATGALYCLNDCEDPARVPDYMAVPGRAAEAATRRINFFRRSMHVFFVDDADIPYMRPSSEHEQEIQAYDLLGIRALGNDFGPVYQNLKAKGIRGPLFNHADPVLATAMNKQAYRLFYLEINRLQFGLLSEAALRRRLPAIDRFLTTLDASPKLWVNLACAPVVERVAQPSRPGSGAGVAYRPAPRL